MNKLGFYGHESFFNNIGNIDWLSIINGCFRNVKFAEKVYNANLINENCLISGILISNNIIKNEIPDFLYYDFNYPSIDTASIFKERINDFTFLCVLNDWKDLYNSLNHEYRSNTAYSLALYQNKEYYINHQKSLKFYKDVDDSYFFKYLNTNNLEYELNYYPRLDESGYESLVEHYSEEDYIKLESIVPQNPTNYEIVNSFEIAYNLFEKGNTSNLVLSKIITTAPYTFKDLYKKYRPFLLFTRNEIPTISFKDIEPLSIYNIMYNAIIMQSISHSPLLSKISIELPEYNLYVLAVKLRNKSTIKYILDLYNIHGKLYKILDLQNECYINPPEEIIDLPIVENLNILLGDELNPYF